MNRTLTEIRGALLFDSWFEERPPVRNALVEDRHLIYEGGGVILDLLVRQSNEDSCLHVGGQILPEAESAEDVADLPVVIHRGPRATHTRTNPIGEFMFHSSIDEPFDLVIEFREKRFVIRNLSTSDPREWQFSHSGGGR